MAELGTNPKVAFLTRLLGTADGWAGPDVLLADLCRTFEIKDAGIRWPGEGTPILVAETRRVSDPVFRYPFTLGDQQPGLFWANGDMGDLGGVKDEEFLKLAALAIGCSKAIWRFLGPIADQTRIAQRLTDAAKVAGRVAHDMDNVFQGVTGFNALTLELLAPGSMEHQNIQEAEKAAQQGMKFCGQLHQLSRGGNAKPMPASVSIALGREASRVAAEHPKLRIEGEAPENLPSVAVESGGLQTILGHLLDNAAEASPAGGTVKAVARLMELAPTELPGFLGCPTAGPNVEVKIHDPGPGLTDEARRRMFVEPFFTTKYRHRGLGLPVVYRMLYAHRGGAQVDSGSGRGTTIRVVFPLASTRSTTS